MAKIRNRNGEDRDTPHGPVVADGLLEMPAEDVYGYTCQAGWDAADKEATTAHTKGERSEGRAVKADANAEETVPVVGEPAAFDG